MQRYRKFIVAITGDSSIFSLEHRIFNISSLIITTFACIGGVANFILDLHPMTVWLSFIGAGISAILYYYARIEHIFSAGIMFAYVITTIVTLSIIHFYNGGLNGPVIYLIIMLLNIFLLIIPVRFQYWVYAILYVNILILLVLEYYYPHWVLPYQSNKERMIDHAVTMLYTLFYTTLVIITFRRGYNSERKKVEVQNTQLTNLNEQINWQRKRLESKTLELEEAVQVAHDRHEYINTLLRELNHRVKNNLQLISSLLNLQAHAVQNEDARNALLEGKNRLLSMILIHQRLYQNENATEVFMTDYLKELTETIMFTYSGIFDEEMLDYEIEPLWMDVESAIPVGLICNELISNAFKHAFKDTPDPQLSIRLKRQETHYLLEIADNGSGIQKTTEGKTFGLELVNTLVKQLNGSISTDYSKGTRFSILFCKTRQQAQS